MASKKSTIDEAFPGDIIGIPDNGTFELEIPLLQKNSCTIKVSHRSHLSISDSLTMRIH